MRLGAHPCLLRDDLKAREHYGVSEISERHRHRFEFNSDYQERLTAAGLHASGTSPDGELVEIVEISEHPWFVAVQFHPEFKSQPTKAHPLFAGFVEAAMERKKKRRRTDTESTAQAETF